MSGFLINFSLSSSVNQQDLIQKIKTFGADVIQTGSGLCVKSDKPLDTIKDHLGLDQASGVAVVHVQANDETLSPDVKAFLT